MYQTRRTGSRGPRVTPHAAEMNTDCLLSAESGMPALVAGFHVKGVTRYISGYVGEGKGEIFWAIVSHSWYALCYNGVVE
jgi:hypothetical protein